jgi:signal transduction histidine kinase
LRERDPEVGLETSRLARLRKLTQVSRALTNAISLEQVLSLTVTEAVELLDGLRGALLLYDESGRLQVRATHAIAQDIRGRRDEPEATLEQLLADVLGAAFATSAVVVPLIVSGKVTGALAVIRGNTNIPEEEEEWLLSALADQTMVALEKARLDEIQDRAQQQALIARVGHRLLAQHDVQSLFAEVMQSVCETLGADLVGIFGHRLESNSFELLDGVGWPNSTSGPAAIDSDHSSWESRAFDGRVPVSFGAKYGADGARSVASLYEPRVTSGLVVAIEPPGRYGVLGVYTRALRIFTQEESDLIASLGALLSSALERQAAEARLRTTAEARNDLLAIVSHDLRNPLFAITSAASLLLEPDVREDPASVARWVEVIDRNGRRMASMIRDLLDFESLRGAGLSVKVGEHAVASILDETLEMMQPQAKEKSIALARRSTSATTAWLDRDRTLQVLSNLLGNAVKFTPEGGSITLGADLLGGEVRFFVRDTGPGIPTENLGHIFDRYWQAKRSDRRGIGLGLPIAKGLVEAQGGKLWVESELGRGTTFFFTAPTQPISSPRSR